MFRQKMPIYILYGDCYKTVLRNRLSTNKDLIKADCPVYGVSRNRRNAIKALFRRDLVDYG